MSVGLVILLIILIIIAVVVLFIKDMRTDKTLTIYQVNELFDTSRKSDRIYPPFNELFPVEDDAKKADFIIFSDYAEIDTYLNKLKFDKKTYVYAINSTDTMASKSSLANHMQVCGLSKFIPKTFILLGPNKSDLSGLEEGRIYIIKKNVQRQEGNSITKDIKFIKEEAGNQGYVVCQELLQNPFLVNKRKINLRVYFLITLNSGVMNFYIYNNGFMYYTSDFFVPNSTDEKVNITTGYIDRRVYQENPLTILDFYAWLGNDKSERLKANMIGMFKGIKQCYERELLAANHDSQNYRFNIFGVDVAPDSDLNVTIMEINKAPDLSYKDDRDAAVKLNMIKDVMKLVGMSKKGNAKNFISL